LINKQIAEIIGRERSLSLLILRGKQPSAETVDITQHKRVEHKTVTASQKGMEIRRLEQGTNESK
jgi:hypothetical protein